MPNIEELLRKAMQEGKFNDLPGKGKPLKKEETNPHADPDWELAYHMLREAGYSLPWIEMFHEIDVDLSAARASLEQARTWHQAAISSSQPASLANAEWDRALVAFKDKLTTLNKRIRDCNLQVPNSRFQRLALNYEAEVNRIIAGE
jgi:DnaJ family protein C protein 28